MIVTRFKRIPGETTKVSRIHDVGLEDIEELVSNPVILFPPNFRSKDEMKASQDLLYWGDMLDRHNPRVAGNWGDRCAIVLDYDDSVTIDEFINIYDGQFQWYLYTSISHSEEQHKFRVIIPTNKTFTMTKILGKLIIGDFPGVDESTCSPRGFYAPHRKDTKYRFHVSYGDIYDINKYDKSVKLIEDAYAIAEQERQAILLTKQTMFTNNGSFAQYKKKAEESLQNQLDEIPRFQSGNRYTRLVSMTGKLINAKYPQTGERLFSDYEVLGMILGHTNDPAIRSMVNSFLKR